MGFILAFPVIDAIVSSVTAFFAWVGSRIMRFVWAASPAAVLSMTGIIIGGVIIAIARRIIIPDLVIADAANAVSFLWDRWHVDTVRQGCEWVAAQVSGLF